MNTRVVILSASEKTVLRELQYTCTKIFQAYRLRMGLFKRRYSILSEIDKSEMDKHYERIVHNDALLLQLRNILDKEKRVLSIIEKSQPEVGNNLGYALHQLEEAKRIRGAYLENIPLPHNRGLPVKEAEEFLLRMINSMQQMKSDLEGIKARMQAEEHFLNRNALNRRVVFSEYFLAWEAEIRANDIMMRHLNGVLNANRDIVVDKMRVDWMSLMGVLSAGLGGASAIMAVSAGSEGAGWAAKIMFALGAVWIIASFLYNMSSLSKEVFIDTRREDQLVRDIKEKLASRSGFN
jgi:hypothetical protein